MTGGGLTGAAKESVLSTEAPDGSSSFYAVDTCASCHFDGRTGATEILAQGTTGAHGLTRGTFMVIAGGKGGGGLSQLAGWGTFTSVGAPANTLRLASHFSIS